MSIISVLKTGWPHYVLTGAIMSGGDAIAQKVFEKKETFDLSRNARFAALGAVFVSPVLRVWFHFLDKKFGNKGAITPLKKLIIDQSVMAPTINTGILVFMEMTQLTPLEEMKKKCRDKLPAIIANQYKVWPFVQLFNFYLVPLEYRVLVLAVVAFFWNIYLATAIQDKSIATAIQDKSIATAIQDKSSEKSGG